MKAKILFLIMCLFALLILFASCSDAGVAPEATSAVTSAEIITSVKASEAQTEEITAAEISETEISEAVTSAETTVKVTETETETETEVNGNKGLLSRLFSFRDDIKEKAEDKKPVNENYDFSDCCFVGNSRVLSLYEYGLVPEADVYAKVGLNIRTVYTDSVQGSSLPVFNRMNLKRYKKILLVFGDNEIGWPHLEVFISEYEELIDKIREKQGRNVEIYIQSVLPVSKAVSDKRVDGYSLNGIRNLNKLLKEMCDEKGCTYIGTPDGLTDSAGYLKADAASDGVHFGGKYCKLWLDYLRKYMG